MPVKHPATADVEERIVDAAYECFERFGIAKTTMEDIAKQANVSRQTVYRYFNSKDNILDSICCREAVKINAQVRQGLRRNMDFASKLTEALVIIILSGKDNIYLRNMIEAPSFQAHVLSADSRVHQLNRGYWRDTMKRASDNGELSDDLSLDEILSWLTMMQATLQFRLTQGEISEEELRRIIRRFVVQPLTTH